MDRWLGTANSPKDLYEMLDFMHENVNKEYKKRFEINRQ